MRNPRTRRPLLPARLSQPPFRFEVAAREAGRRLDEILSERLGAGLRRRVSKSEARKLVVVGAVRLRGRPLRQPALVLAAGALIEVSMKPGRAADRPLSFVLTAREILYEDAVLIAVDKPAGLPTHPTADPLRASLVSALKAYLGEAAYLGIHQRLDRDTTGVVLFAKHEDANASLAEQFASRRVAKVYRAWCAPASRDSPGSWRATDRVAPIDSKPPRIGVVRSGGVEAITDFTIVQRLSHAWLVEARPLTGRKHQIRVQLAAAGLPILGDVLYGGPTHAGDLRMSRALLHAMSVELDHPITRTRLRLESPLPADFQAFTNAARPRASAERPPGRRGAHVRPRRG